jgi:Tfp pilus assembly protein FimT
MIELALTIVVIAIMSSMMIPKVGQVMQASRVNRQTAIIAADLEQAFTLAARLRKPMRITCDCVNQTYTVADRADGTVRLRRQLGQDADLGALTLDFVAPAGEIVDVFPSGVSTEALTVRITSGASTRGVTLSSAGHVRIIP